MTDGAPNRLAVSREGEDRSDLKTLRRELRRARRQLPRTEHRERSRRLIVNLGRIWRFRCADRVACYLPNDGEVDLTPLIGRFKRLGKRCYLPVLDPLRPRRLWFAPYRPGDPLAPNRYGIPEPCARGVKLLPAWALDLILAPLVAFDEAGNRLGMGGGYYDRTLAFLRQRAHWHRPRLLGIAFEFQRVEPLAVNAWDVPLDGIVTDRGVRFLQRRTERP